MPTTTDRRANLTKVCVGLQSSAASKVAAQYILDFTDFTLAPAMGYAISAARRGSLAPRKVLRARYWGEGGLTVEADPNALGMLFCGMWGVSTTSGTTDPFTHTWEHGASTEPNKFNTIIAAYEGGPQEVFGGFAANSVALAWSGEEDAVLACEIAGRSVLYDVYDAESTVVPASAGADADDPLVGCTAVVESPEETALLDVLSGRIELTHERPPRWTYAGSVIFPTRPAGHRPQVSAVARMTLTLLFESDRSLQRFLNRVGATYPLTPNEGIYTQTWQVIWRYGTAGAAGYRRLEIQLPTAYISEWGRTLPLDDYITQDVTIEALYDTTLGGLAKVILHNGVSSYTDGTALS